MINSEGAKMKGKHSIHLFSFFIWGMLAVAILVIMGGFVHYALALGCPHPDNLPYFHQTQVLPSGMIPYFCTKP